MKKRLIKCLLPIMVINSVSFASDCKIMTSPIDLSTMRLGYTNWYAQTRPIVEGKTFKYVGFTDAYSEFDEKFTKIIKEKVCKENKWAGVANYKIEWQQTKDAYNFVGTYDTFGNK